MDTQREATQPSDSARAEELFLAWLERGEQGARESFDELCRRSPDLRTHLERLAERYERARSTLARLVPRAADGDTTQPSGTARYEIRGEIARGGMGVILEVYEPSLRRTLAMKRLRPSRGDERFDCQRHERSRSRLLAEAQILGQLDHPGVVPVIEVGSDEARELYFTMRRVHGRDFGQVIDRVHAHDDEWSLTRAVGVLLRVCEAMAYAHEKGVVHRDLKPANVMVGRFGETYVMDWGLARARGDDAARPSATREGEASRAAEPGADASTLAADPGARSASGSDAASARVSTTRSDESSSSSAMQTLEGEVVGTPAYMPPEQATGRIDDVGEPADIYALGAMLYHLLAGRRPYAPSSGTPLDAAQTLARVIAGPPEPLRLAARRAPEELIAISEKAMARDRAQRYASMSALSDDLRAWLEGRVVRAHRTGPIPELVKWVRRNKGAAAAIAIAAVALATVAVVQTMLKRQISEQAELASARADELRREDYFNRIALAANAYEKGEIRHMRDLLEGCEESARGWEWSHLARELDTSDRVIAEACDYATVAFDVDGSGIVSMCPSETFGPGRMRWWNASTGALLRTLELPSGRSFALSPNQDLVARFGAQSEVFLWHTSDGSLRAKLTGARHMEPSASFHPHKMLLAVGGTGPIEVWDIENQVRVHALDAGLGLAAVAWAADGSRIFAGGEDGRVAAWDSVSGELLVLAQHDVSRIATIEASPDGRWIATSDFDKHLRILDARTLHVHQDLGIRRQCWGPLRWTRDARLFAIADGSVIRLLDTADWHDCGALVGHAHGVWALSFDAEGRRAVSGSGDGTVRVWDVSPTARRGGARIHDSDSCGGCLSANGLWAAFAWVGERQVELWSVASRTFEGTLELPAGTVPPNGMLALAPDGSKIALRGGNDLVVVDTRTKQEFVRLPNVGPERASFDPRGSLLSIVGRNRTLSVWSLLTRESLWTVEVTPTPTEWPSAVAGGSWSPDGSRIVTMPHDGGVQIRDAHTGAVLRESSAGPRPYTDACFSSDGRTLYVASLRPGTLERRDAETLQTEWIRELALETPFPLFTVSADARRVFLQTPSRTLDILDAANGRLVASLPLDASTHALLASPVDAVLISASRHGVHFWETTPRR